MLIRDRIKELRRVPAAALRPNPKNWRTHPNSQKDALKGLLAEIGFAGATLARELPDGTLQLIDGHLRAEVGFDQMIPVLVLDVTEEEANKLLLLFDPLSAMASASQDALQSLLSEVEVSSAELESRLRDMAEPKEKQLSDSAGEDLVDLKPEYSVLVKCPSERDQKLILAELSRHGLDMRALVVGFPPEQPRDEQVATTCVADGVIEIRRRTAIERTPRVMQLEGMFDVPRQAESEHVWRVNAAFDKPWSIGLIVGPSGSGKSTVARELFGDSLVSQWTWSATQSVLDGFSDDLGIAEITGYLSSAGFSSPPSWLKPYHVLSNGEQFRVNLARTLAERRTLAAVDEFTSVVDRTVAQIGSAAVAKAVRRSGQKFVAVTCHYDVEEWLQPDWKLEMPHGEITWRSLRRRPPIQLRVRRTDSSAWTLFRDHHYLSHDLNRTARCFVGEVCDRPAVFTAVLHNPRRSGRGFYRESRTVCLPDYQGVGIGNAMSEYVASVFAALGAGYRSVTSHPAMIRHRLRSRNWRCVRKPSLASGATRKKAAHVGMSHTAAVDRMTASFEWVGEVRPDDAVRFGLLS